MSTQVSTGWWQLWPSAVHVLGERCLGTSCTHYTHTEQLDMVGSCLFVNKLAGLLWGRPEQADEQCITMYITAAAHGPHKIQLLV